MTEIPKVKVPTIKGPASYFPSIEKTYGKPISHWMAVLKEAGELKHMELDFPQYRRQISMSDMLLFKLNGA